MPQVIFIRHGERSRQGDQDAPLTELGAQQVRDLATRFNELGVAPDLYLTSSYEHAKRTAEIMSRHVVTDRHARIIEVDTLTPHTPKAVFSIERIFERVAD